MSSENDQPESTPDPNAPKLGFWESLSKEPPREGDKMKAVIFGILLAVFLFSLAWFLLHKNADPLA